MGVLTRWRASALTTVSPRRLNLLRGSCLSALAPHLHSVRILLDHPVSISEPLGFTAMGET